MNDEFKLSLDEFWSTSVFAGTSIEPILLNALLRPKGGKGKGKHGKGIWSTRALGSRYSVNWRSQLCISWQGQGLPWAICFP